MQDLNNRETMCRGGAVYGNSLYFLLKFSVNLKLLKKITSIKNKTKCEAPSPTEEMLDEKQSQLGTLMGIQTCSPMAKVNT